VPSLRGSICSCTLRDKLLSEDSATATLARRSDISVVQSFVELYRQMATARLIDEYERNLVGRGEAFFQVSGAGHEATAVFERHLRPDDYLHCHYRDKALMLARGVPIAQFFNGLLCNANSPSAGRQMSAHLSDPERHLLSLVGPVGNNALQAVGVAAEIKNRANEPIVLCSLGDGTSQQGEFLESVAEAVRWNLPVLFVVQNNRLSISTDTRGMTFFSQPDGDADSFYGLPIHWLDGRNVLSCDEPVRKLIAEIRRTRRPSLVVLDLERLSDHTNSDDERVYRSGDEIDAARRTGDPVDILRRWLLEASISERTLANIEADIRIDVEAAAAEALKAAPPIVTFTAKAELPPRLHAAEEFRGDDQASTLTMADAIRETLRYRMTADIRVTLYGEDIEDPKGDVFGITRGLTRGFQGRVRNAPISESTIVGTSIGRALAGGRPVAFIQFADFLPLAFNQIATELGSMHWRTNGGWQCPVIIMVACGGYRPGLGPFHAHTFESVIAHVPGVDVVMPSTASDAAGMLNAAFESGRPTLFFYPKACLNDRERMTSWDVARQLVPVGKSRIIRAGRDITLVSWGSTVQLCEKAASALAEIGCSTEVIDLRWLSPWDEDAIFRSARTTGKLIVVHEDNRTAGFGAEVLATVAEKIGNQVFCRRIARPDTYVPCHFGNQLEVLPSFKSILTAAAEMLDLDLTWKTPLASPEGIIVVESIGSSPADEIVTIAELLVKPGQTVTSGELLASLECDKAVFELSSPSNGVVQEISVSKGQQVRVGTTLLTIRTDTDVNHKRQPLREDSGIPVLRRRPLARSPVLAFHRQTLTVGLSAVYPMEGGASVTNKDLIVRFPTMSEEGILSRCGIERRSHVLLGQTALTMGIEAAANALKGEGLRLSDIDLIICSTSTPPLTSPSLACLVLLELSRRYGETDIPAYDVMAACTGYLYALSAAWDYLQSVPSGKVLVITTEEMSGIVDPQDFGTAILFGDAATATIVYGARQIEQAKTRLLRPLLGAHGEDGSVLRVPRGGASGFVHMEGKKVFAEAVHRMTSMLEKACQQNGYSVGDLDLIIPHQANGRIIEAVQARLKCSAQRIRNDVLDHGNTSSSTIPLALVKVLENRSNQRVGLCAFGAGYTFGAALLQPV
jgi:2-oxoisovalerate dehydrogenase E1 component